MLKSEIFAELVRLLELKKTAVAAADEEASDKADRLLEAWIAEHTSVVDWTVGRTPEEIAKIEAEILGGFGQRERLGTVEQQKEVLEKLAAQAKDRREALAAERARILEGRR